MTPEPSTVGPWAVLAFVCELAMLGALAVAGWRLAPAGPLAYLLMVALPLAAAVLWGLLLAPKAPKGLKGRTATVGKTLVYLAAGVLLAVAGLWPWGLALSIVAVVDLVMAERETAAPRD